VCGGAQEKSEGHIKKISAGASRRHSAPHFQIASDATGWRRGHRESRLQVGSKFNCIVRCQCWFSCSKTSHWQAPKVQDRLATWHNQKQSPEIEARRTQASSRRNRPLCRQRHLSKLPIPNPNPIPNP